MFCGFQLVRFHITYNGLGSMDHTPHIIPSLCGVWMRHLQLPLSGCSMVLLHTGCRNVLCSLISFLHFPTMPSSKTHFTINSISVFFSEVE